MLDRRIFLALNSVIFAADRTNPMQGLSLSSSTNPTPSDRDDSHGQDMQQTTKQGNSMQAIEIETEIDNNHEIHIKLPQNTEAGTAKVIILFEGGTKKNPKPLQLGRFEGQIQISDDFDDPLPDEFWLGGKP